MHRKRVFLVTSCVFIVAAICLAVFFGPKRPLRSLEAEDVVSAQVGLYPPDVEMELTPEQIGELVPLLRDTVIYRWDPSFSLYDGQAVVYTLHLTDGTTKTVQAYGQFLVLDEQGYRTKYEPSEVLHQFGNRLARGE